MSRARSSIRLLLFVAVIVGVALGGVLYWLFSREAERLDEEQAQRAARTVELAEILLKNRLDRGLTVLRAIGASRAVQDAMRAKSGKALHDAIEPFSSEFGGTMMVIDDAEGKPIAWSSPLAVVQLGVDPNSIEGAVETELALAAGDLVVRYQQPIGSEKGRLGTLRGAVTLGRLFTLGISQDLQVPVAVFVGMKPVHHTFPASPPPPGSPPIVTLHGENFDIAYRRVAGMEAEVWLVIGISRAPIDALLHRTALVLLGAGAGALAIVLVAMSGYLALGRAQQRLTLQRDEARDRFEALRAVVHDIKAPVSGIQLRAEGLLDHDLDPAVDAALTQMIDTCERLNLYLANILTAAEGEEGPVKMSREVVLLPGLIEEIAERIEPIAARHRIVIKVETDLGLPPLTGDAAYLERAIWNLAANALSLSPAPSCVTLFARRDAEAALIGVEDDGPGFSEFPPEMAFSRERPKVRHGSFKAGSSGLGLFIVGRIAAAHGGSASAENLSRGGARVTLRIPFSS